MDTAWADAVWGALEVGPWALAAGVAVSFLAGVVQGTLGFGMGLVSVPILALVSPLLAPSPQVLLSLPLALAMMAREWRAADMPGALRLSVGGAVGAALGAAVLKVADRQIMDLALGSVVVVAVALMAAGLTVRRTGATLLGGGIASGFMGTLSAIGGPPLALLYRDAAGATLRATLAVVFGFGALVTIAGRAWAGVLGVGDLWRALVMTVGLLAGVWASKTLLTKVEGRPLRVAVLVFAGVAGVSLVVKALVAA
ncbi:MAG: sulfite exporter TauE/SafE family protein [Myxococcales bacterium]|nr:sulfite exporter TauE/SafE family protein [Myxococcales bacterium]MCB9524059.1 sulfite exporter TauE/SafE family protein [Myxococcales bacterium]